MSKKDNFKTFIDEICSTPLRKKYETNKIVYIHIDETWSVDLSNMVDYETLNNEGFRYLFIIIDNFSNYL